MSGAERDFVRFARRFLLGVALAPLLTLSGWAFPGQNQHPGLPRAERHEGRHEIDRLEDKWHDAVLKNDALALESLMADEFVGIRSNGTLETKEQTLDRIRSGVTKLASYDVLERKVRFFGPTAVVTSLVQIEGVGPEGNMAGAYRYTRVYARDPHDGWKVVNFEATRLNDPDSLGAPPSGKR